MKKFFGKVWSTIGTETQKMLDKTKGRIIIPVAASLLAIASCNEDNKWMSDQNIDKIEYKISDFEDLWGPEESPNTQLWDVDIVDYNSNTELSEYSSTWDFKDIKLNYQWSFYVDNDNNYYLVDYLPDWAQWVNIVSRPLHIDKQTARIISTNFICDKNGVYIKENPGTLRKVIGADQETIRNGNMIGEYKTIEDKKNIYINIPNRWLYTIKK